MEKNPNISNLAATAIANKVFDEKRESVRVHLSEGISAKLSLNATTDSIAVVVPTVSAKVSIVPGPNSVLLGPISIVGIAKLAMYCNTTSPIATTATFTLEVSPSDIDEVWIAKNTISPCLSAGNCGDSVTSFPIVARRARITCIGGIPDGSCDLYLVGQ